MAERIIQCQRCGHEWQPQKENPKCCPACKSYKYRKSVNDKYADAPNFTEAHTKLVEKTRYEPFDPDA